MGVITLLGIGLVVLIGFAFNEAAEEIGEEFGKSFGVAQTSDYVIAIETCGTDSIGFAEATGTITNTSAKRQGFEINIRFTTPDNILVAEGVTFVDTLDIGQSGAWRVGSLTQAPPTGAMCTLGPVNYSIFDNEESVVPSTVGVGG